MVSKYDAVNPPALRRLVATGTNLRPFSRDVMDACFKAAHEQYDEDASKNAAFKKVYEAWRKYRDEQLLWFRVTEGQFDSYMQAVSGPGDGREEVGTAVRQGRSKKAGISRPFCRLGDIQRALGRNGHDTPTDFGLESRRVSRICPIQNR